ncbi:MAG TPA: hypothetical protein QGF95_08890 [Candidatus Latescibacteria bacterium]|nr:hypothetical protein [Candidatus Latescibacterota bacterium]
MKDRLIICNDDGIQMLHHAVPGSVEQSVRDWVDFFLQECNVEVFSYCTAFPDKTHHETTVGERYFENMEVSPSQSQLHNGQALDELALAGTDALHVVADQVHQRSKRVLASVRMSDVHHASALYGFMAPDIFRNNPDWRIRQQDGSQDVALDYSHEGVRAHRLAIIEEIVSTHAVDGIELDFMRSCRYFPEHLATSRMNIMNDFVEQVHSVLAAARDRCLLGVRLPPSLAECPGLGLDPDTWIRQGWVDYVAPSDFMWLDYGIRVEDYAGLCAGTDCGVYPCLNPFAAEWVNHRAVNAYTPNPVNFNRRVFFSDEQFRGCLRNYDRWGQTVRTPSTSAAKRSTTRTTCGVPTLWPEKHAKPEGRGQPPTSIYPSGASRGPPAGPIRPGEPFALLSVSVRSSPFAWQTASGAVRCRDGSGSASTTCMMGMTCRST